MVFFERNRCSIDLIAERISPEQIKELCESPTKLQQYVKEQAAKYPSKILQNRNHKRKASTELMGERHVKMAKLCDLYGMKEKDALNKSLLGILPLTMASTTSSVASVNGDEASSTTTSYQIVRDLSGECSAIELNLRRLCALCKLTHPEFKPTTIPKEGNIKVIEKGCHGEEYKVSKVIKLDYDNRPLFEVKWEGYEDLTWEPIKNIWDCSAFQVFTDQFIRSRRTDMEYIWNELITTIADQSLEPQLTDLEAIEQTKKFNYNDFLAHFFMLVRMRRANKNKNTKSYQNVYDFVLNDMKYLRYYIQRLDQLQNMYEFQQRINIVDKSKNLHVVNVIDFELPPMDDFTYTNDVIPRDGIVIPDDPPVGCNCTEDGPCSIKSDCCPKQFDAEFPYTTRGLVRVKQGTPIFECNKACKCSETCPNRVVQKGRKQTLCIFKTKQRGWGVHTERAIAKGQYICEYVGEIISYEETERRGKEYDAVGRTYLFDLDFNEKDNPYTVDAAKFGNVSRFINHSCDPNLGVWAVWTNCLDLNLPKLCLFTLRPIKENEELTFDYMNSTNSGREQPEIPDVNDSLNENVIDPVKCEPIEDERISVISSTPIIQVDTKEIHDELVIKAEFQDDIKQEIIKHETDINGGKTDAIEATKEQHKEGFTCRCGAANCRKIIFC